MTPDELRADCEAAIAAGRGDGFVIYKMRGKWNPDGLKRLAGKGSPMGKVRDRLHDKRLLVSFSAREVLAWLDQMEAKMEERTAGHVIGTENTSGTPRRVLTPMQRAAHRLLGGLGEMLERGEPGRTRRADEAVAEQHTAALLGLTADAITHGYEAELVALVRAWRLEREGGG